MALWLFRDAVDAKLGIALAVPLVLLVMLAPPHLEDFHFFAASVRDDGRLDRGAGNDRLPDAHAIAFADDHQDLIERHLGANVRRDLFDLELFARRDLVLLAAGFYDRIHVKTPARMAPRKALDYI